LTSSQAEREAVVGLILESFPDQIDLVSAQLDAVGQASLGLTVASSLVIVPVALGVLRLISAAVNHAWEAAEPVGFLRNQIVAFLMLAAAGVLLPLALIWVSIAGVVRTNLFAKVLEVLPALDAFTGVSGKFPATTAVTLVTGLLCCFVPNTRVRFRDVWVGAALTGVLWHAALAGFSWYLRGWADLTVHGSIATVVTFLLWVYICAVIVLYGVEFTAAWVWFGEGDRARSAPVS
jgi:membrane protein